MSQDKLRLMHLNIRQVLVLLKKMNINYTFSVASNRPHATVYQILINPQNHIIGKIVQNKISGKSTPYFFQIK